MGSASRRKGKKGEATVRNLFTCRDWQVFPRPRGESGDDMTVLKDGRQFSVEVKNTKSLLFDMWVQCKRQSPKSSRILAWHPSGWGMPADLWVLFVWEKGADGTVWVWRGESVLCES